MPKKLFPAAILWTCFFSATLAAQTTSKVDFGREVQPILREHCFGCHGPSQQMRGLRLDRRRDALPNRVGANGVTILPGNGGQSRLYLRLSGTQAGVQMPPSGPLSAEQINTIKLWIDQGAEWPDQHSGEKPAPPASADASRLMEALRNGDRQAFRRLLREKPAAVNLYGPGGSTPLLYAALYGDAESVRLLLEAGADPNLKNPANASALMYAVDDVQKTGLLLERGADPNARSDDGRTALMIAAGRAGASPVMRLLLGRGATASDQVTSGESVLARAAGSGDPDLIRLLLENGAQRKPLPIAVAMRTGCSACVDILLQVADRTDLNDALAAMLRAGYPQHIQTLLGRGAEVPANALSVLAVSGDNIPQELTQALIKGGSKPGSLPAAEASKPKPAAPAASVRAALARSIPILQRADESFTRQAGCVSCHNNSLAAMAMSSARQNGIPINNATARSQTQVIASFLAANRERALQGLGIPGRQDAVGYILLGLAAEEYPADTTTDAWAHYLKNLQLADGRWWILASRAPLESSTIQATAAAMRSIQVYAPKSRRAEYDAAVQRAAQWLEKAEPANTEDRVFQILGLKWAGADRERIRKAASDLLSLQRPDGGWGQLASLPSDAYATGQALAALQESLLNVNAPQYKRGVQFLLNSQLADGSWYVKTRTFPVQPYFDSDFPHEKDQFISAAATNWAVMALAPAH